MFIHFSNNAGIKGGKKVGKTTFRACDANDNIVEYEIVCTIESEDKSRNYICYTDNTRDSDGDQKVYVSSYEKDGEDNYHLFPISPDEELEWVKSRVDANK